MVKNVQKRGGRQHILSEFSPLQRLHPLQESFSLQNYSPTSMSYSTLTQCSKSTADRHPTRASAAGLQPAPGAHGLADLGPGAWVPDLLQH